MNTGASSYLIYSVFNLHVATGVASLFFCFAKSKVSKRKAIRNLSPYASLLATPGKLDEGTNERQGRKSTV